MRISTRLVVVFINLFCSWVGFATDNFTLTSAYLGDGQFRYELTLHNDPFMKEEHVDFAVQSFTNLIAVQNLSPGWEASLRSHSFSVEDPAKSQTRPYTAYGTAVSSNAYYRTLPEDAIVYGTLILHEIFSERLVPGVTTSANIAFYAKAKTIVPCTAEEADDSPPFCSDTVKLIPDIEIDAVLTISNEVMGLAYSWDGANTMLVQASSDMNSWTNVAYALGTGGTNRWYHSEPLSGYGEFYRVQLVATHHLHSLPPLNSAEAAMPEFAPTSAIPLESQKVSIQKVTDEGIVVSATVAPGLIYELRVSSTENGVVFHRRTVSPESASLELLIEHKYLPEKGAIELLQL